MELLRWFETEVLGFETETCQGSCRDYEPYNSQEVKKEHRDEAKTGDEETAKREAPVPLVTHVNSILHSIFSNVEVFINNQQIYNSNGLYAHKFYISNNFKGAVSEQKGVWRCEGYDYEYFPDEIMEATLSEPFFTRRMKMPADQMAS